MATEAADVGLGVVPVPAALPDRAAEQERLKRDLFAKLGLDKYLVGERRGWEELATELSATAERNGLTDEILAEILAEADADR